jgi:glycosyltransferase involved in cell wall biosynthesis
VTPDPEIRSILIVEDQAHLARGHYSRRFAELARAYVAEGHHVEVLTSQGWLLQGSSPTDEFIVHTYGRVALIVELVGRRLRWVPSFPGDGAVRYVGHLLRVLAMVGSARALCRKGAGRSTDVFVLSIGINLLVAAALAGPGRWLFYAFAPPQRWLAGPVATPLRVWVRWAEQRRTVRGGHARIATPTQPLRDAWVGVAPFLEPTILSLAGCRSDVVPIPDARHKLGIAPHDRVALFFGSRANKDCGVVWSAFSDLPEWRLLIAGPLADAYDPVQHPLAQPPIVRSGYVSETTRDQAYAAADLVVQSVSAGYDQSSGTLMDAIAWGIPVVCSEDSTTADIVRAYELGVTFIPGNASSLVQAVRMVPARLPPDGFRRAQEEFSNEAVAKRHLALLAGPEFTNDDLRGSGGDGQRRQQRTEDPPQ